MQHCCKKKHLAMKRAARKGGSLLSMNDYSLFLHQQLHYHFGGVCNRGAGTEDGGNTAFAEG